MLDQPEMQRADKLPIWLPDKIRMILSETLSRKPIDLLSPGAIGRYFASHAEIEDMYDVISQVENPFLIGINGSRASLKHSPLFENIEAFDAYHGRRAHQEGDFKEYLKQNDFSMEDYQLARMYLKELRFNEGYKRGEQYPTPIVALLVRDIDVLIITGGKHIQGGPRVGTRTNVPFDITVNSPFHMFESDPRDLACYLQNGLAQTIPLKYC